MTDGVSDESGDRTGGASGTSGQPRRGPDLLRWGLVSLFALSTVLRLHGAWAAQPLSGYDGPFHAANMGIILFEGRLPLPDEGWSTFHPPLYYAVSAALWGMLPDGSSSHAVLFALRLLNVAAALALSVAVLVATRWLVPGRPLAAFCATALALFLPMEMGPSFLLGNEMWGAALSAWAVVGLLACLQPGAAARRWIGLGLLLGLGLLTKFNTGVVALASGLAIGVQDVVRLGASPRAGLRVAVLTAVTLGVAGWYFGWNLHLYGRPILMQNEIVTAHMARSGYGPTRPLAGYLSLRPEILQLELDMLLNDESHPEARAAVWPVTFGAVWFDLHSTVLLAPNRNAQSAARILYACGALWTVLALWGAVALLRPPRGSPAVVGAAALALVIVLTLASYGAFTWRVATFSALKGTYLSPSILPWCVFAGAGCDRLASHGGAARAALAALVAGFVVTVTAIYWVGWLAPLPFNPGAYYPNAWSDGATERVTDFFLPPGAIEEAARRYR